MAMAEESKTTELVGIEITERESEKDEALASNEIQQLSHYVLSKLLLIAPSDMLRHVRYHDSVTLRLQGTTTTNLSRVDAAFAAAVLIQAYPVVRVQTRGFLEFCVDVATKINSVLEKLFLSDMISNLVFEELQRSQTDAKKQILNVSSVEALRSGTWGESTLRDLVKIAYPDTPLLNATHVSASVVAKARRLVSGSLDEQDRRGVAFSRSFLGSVDVQFSSYLARCCSAYYQHQADYWAPIVCVTQSAGVGKSRVIYEFAKATLSGDITDGYSPSGPKIDMRVLYINARDDPKWVGFPRTNASLKRWFFGADCTLDLLVQRLESAFAHAAMNWDSVGQQWLELFTEPDYKLRNWVYQMMTNLPATLSPDFVTSDKALLRVLVLTVDEARELGERPHSDSPTFLKLLQQALKKLDPKIRVFVVLVDADPRIQEYVPPIDSDLAQQFQAIQTVQFPPFILNHTMDLMSAVRSPIENLFLLKASVLQSDPELVWTALTCFGRPLWKCMHDELLKVYQPRVAKRLLVRFASRSLLLNKDVRVERNYDASALRGVASLVCRVGVRPRVSSLFGRRFVADFMSVLHFVNHTNDGYVSSYVAEPMLAFGSAHMWYQLNPRALEHHILPQFEDLVLQDVFNVDDVGGVAVRIFLLLAMDAALMSSTSTGQGDGFYKLSADELKDFVFDGQFTSVASFINMIAGTPQPELLLPGCTPAFREKKEQSFSCWLAKWRSWQLGFSQFLELNETPRRETLWFMLSRRAAGVIVRDSSETDLVIPTFHNDSVSYILVRVTNHPSDRFSTELLQDLVPVEIFGKDDELGDVHPQEVIPVSIWLQDAVSEKYLASWYLCPHTNPCEKGVEMHMLCLRGLFLSPDITSRRWPFVSPLASAILGRLSASRWLDPTALWERDLELRSNDSSLDCVRRVLSDSEAKKAAQQAMTMSSIPF